MNRRAETLTVFFAVVAAFGAHGYLPEATPESAGIPSTAISEWIDACEREIDAVHGFVLLRHGRLVAEGYWSPFERNTAHAMFSHSKSFTATAVGILLDEGKMSLDERVADIFPDKLPEKPCRNVLEMRVRDLLQMSTGHDCDLVYKVIRPGADDWVRTFLAVEPKTRPGLVFNYNTVATHVLSAIVTRRTGVNMMDFLQERLLRPIGIVDGWSWNAPDGTAIGGYGMNFTCRDLALFGQLYLQRGEWEGRRILSENWVALASAREIDSAFDDNPEARAGYGFQFWRCTPRGVYRADGALGQFTIIMTEQDAVLSLISGTENTRREQELVWERLLPAMGGASMPEDPAACAALRAKCAALSLPCPKGARDGGEGIVGRTFAFPENAFGAKWMRLEQTAGGLDFVWGNAIGEQRASLGFSEWRIGGKVRVQPGDVYYLREIPGEHPVAGAYAWNGSSTLRLCLRFYDGPAFFEAVLRFLADGSVGVEGRFRAKNTVEINLKGTRL